MKEELNEEEKGGENGDAGRNADRMECGPDEGAGAWSWEVEIGEEA